MKSNWLGLAILSAGIVAGGLFVYRRSATAATSVDSGFWQRALEAFGGRAVSYRPYEHTPQGFAQFLSDSHVGTRFTVSDIITPHQRDRARLLGFSNFLPTKRWWPRTAALIRLANYACTNVVDDVVIRNHWRPLPYNTTVGGLPDSAHLDARAVDMDFDYESDRRIAETVLRELQHRHSWLRMGLGLGPRTIHLDILTGKPQRPNIWCYEGYNCDRSVG